MEIINNNKFLVGLFVMLSVAMHSQTVNTGDFFIIPGTEMGSVGELNNTAAGNLINDGDLHLYSDFINDGLMTFTPDENGVIMFKGSSDQKIEGTGKSEFQNVQFNNTGSGNQIELHGEISIAKQADFTNGIVNNRDFGGLMVFEQGATQVNATGDSHVTGEVRKNGEDAFVFPIGHDGNLRQSAIAATKEALSSFKANYFLENSDPLYPHADKTKGIDLINNAEYWVLEKKEGTADAILTLSWDEYYTTPPNMVTEPDEVHIVRWDTNRSIWVDEGGIVDTYNKTVTTPVSVSGYGVFTLARAVASGPGSCKKLVVYNAISPNGDGLNDYLRIDGLRDCSGGDNTVQIYDRWGVKVYETHNYGENGNVFNGYANVKGVIGGNKVLQAGTYFYVIDSGGGQVKKSGYLYMN